MLQRIKRAAVGADAALGVVGHLRPGFAQFKLCDQLLDLGRLLVETRSELRNCRLEVLQAITRARTKPSYPLLPTV
jgi:hypothetical protein